MAEDTEARGSRAQQVASQLEAQILAEHVGPGTRIGLRTELISRFGVSPSVMNEALRILRERGLVTVKPGPNGGVFVDNPPPQIRLGAIDVWLQALAVAPEHVLEARSYLDGLFPSVAMRRATPEDLRDMAWALDEMRAASARDDAKAYLDSAMRLHLAIARASRIEMLAGLYESIVTILSASVTKAVFIADMAELRKHNLELHADLVKAIREKDALALEKLITLHQQDMRRVS